MLHLIISSKHYVNNIKDMVFVASIILVQFEPDLNKHMTYIIKKPANSSILTNLQTLSLSIT